ncbi:dihydropteroate synthase [Jidongwangia harbinensis]|uniref:dihydropteroate synthase n=1 Tax=Jidongwangia harbinensis TaxID=2878561 RepID=UPI001CD996D5|nr:dihydropteroate synthase [Jidongwangia harbinensis]MCA2211977.1 dihydropteroate synthase [Jidongwangia harbinensis]
MQRVIGGRTFDFARRVAVMAIVNRTPDSFHDRGRTFALERAVEAVRAAADAGADWIDVGGVPFAPGPEVSVAEELDRVLPVVHAARDLAVVSVDTYRPAVARAAVAAGAGVVNDTSGLRDPAMADAIAGSDAMLVITHSLAAPRTPYPRPTYADVTSEVADFLQQRVQLALSRGVRPDQIIVDPGHDLNKNTYHSLELTRRLDEIARIGYPMLAAVSNKDFIGETLDAPQPERLAGTLAAVVFCVLRGARIVRVHDVRAVVDAVRMTEAMLGLRPPVVARHNR